MYTTELIEAKEGPGMLCIATVHGKAAQSACTESLQQDATQTILARGILSAA